MDSVNYGSVTRKADGSMGQLWISTLSGSPTGGPYRAMDASIGADGTMWVNTVAGSPGTWIQVGSVLLSPLTVPNGGTGVATFTLNGVLYGNGTSALQVTTQGPTNSVLVASAGAPSFSATPTVTTLTTTGLVAAGGNLTVTGTATHTSSSASALTVGLAGATNPAFVVDASTASQQNGLVVKGSAASLAVAISVAGGGTNIPVTIDANGSGAVTIAGTSTGVTTVGHGLTLTSGTTLTLTGDTVAGTPTWSSNQAITLSTAAQPNITSVGTLTSLTMGGTLTIGANTLALASATISGTPTWSSNQAITVSTAAQPNITSVGTLTGLATAGNHTFSGATRSIWTSDANELDLGANATAIVKLTSGGGVQIGSPTGGDKGVGTLNAVNLYIAGVLAMSNPLTTTGDIIYSSSGTTAARLAVGTGTNPLLTVSGGVPAWATLATLVQPCCRVYKSSAQSTNSGASTALTFDSERYDTDTMHSTVTNTSRITFTTAGVYTVGATVEFAVSAVGNRRELAVVLNGTTNIVVDQGPPVLGGVAGTNLAASATYKFAANDYVEVFVVQDSGGALNINATGNYTPEAWATFESA